jgi:hypothetical protein
MVDFYLVMGEARSGKSATIRALTGVTRTSFGWPVDFTSIPNRPITNVYVRSVQEGDLWIDPSRLVAETKANQAEVVILPLKIGTHRKRPTGQDYIDEIRKAGFKISGIATLGKLYFPQNINPAVVRNLMPHPEPANARSAILRAAWSIF